MTNKVKPFYIRITDDMTPQMVQDAFDKCHNLDVRASNNGDVENIVKWKYFGVCGTDGTYLSRSSDCYHSAQEITLEQLDEWLGLEVEQEWKNGDKCLVRGSKAIWIGNDWMDDTQCIVAKYKEGCGYVDLVFAANEFISKPETPEDKG